MSQDRERFIRQLEDAADNIADVPRHELQVLLRRAAIRLRNLSVPGDLDQALREFMDVAGIDPERSG
jgi:hypothetical protein